MQGIKNMAKSYKRDTEQAAIVLKVARIHGVTTRYVKMVIKGDRENEAILADYMEILETGNEVENRLKEEIKKLVPFN